MNQRPDRLLLAALFIGLVFHGTIFFFTYEQTYDSFVHMFFADHYARSWFEPWDNRWYTGFNVTSYPPLVHQLTALLSHLIGLQYAFIAMAIGIFQLLIIGSYRFAKLWTTHKAAGYAALFTCFSTSIMEALHLFGQLPTLMGMACLLNALPEIYRWIRYGKYYRLLTAVSIMGVGVTSHHVTTIFGMVFFVAPVMGLAVMDTLLTKTAGHDGSVSTTAQSIRASINQELTKLSIKSFLIETYAKRKEIIIFVSLVPVIMMLVFPYFYWSSTDPISQVSIPHGSRDSFIDVPSSGLMFFLIPMGILLLLLPYVFKRVWTKRNIFIGLSFTLVVILGTGGTTPIPKLMLGENAFNILTLDRFTFWATIIAIPFIGEFFCRLCEGDFKEYFTQKWGIWPHRLLCAFFALSTAGLTILIINLSTFRPLQPESIDVKPIVQFLERDQHDKWRFITLGFGDQMAWLSSQTTAQSVDGNYHSARRLPEMTTRPLERLENSKFKGVQGLGSLQQFLTIPEKYYLKFIFSNDKFYDPILYYTGWERVQRLENGIMVWQKQDIPPLPSVLPMKNLPQVMKLMWAILPLSSLIFAFGINFLFVWYTRFSKKPFYDDDYKNTTPELPKFKKSLFRFMGIWCFVIVSVVSVVVIKQWLSNPNDTPETVVEAYYNALDFKYFKAAYEFFDPTDRPSFDEYFIKLSVEDGIVASYAKLDNMNVELEKLDDKTYIAKVENEWVTPLEQYTTHSEHTVVDVKGKWYIKAPSFDANIPSDTYIEDPLLSFHLQGKRRASTEATMHDDVMDRPELHIISARLVKKDSTYSVVGELQNIDNLPAHVTLQAKLYDEYDRELVSYNAKYVAIHRIMPKETMTFRIDFEETAWAKIEDLDPGNFNPDEFTDYKFEIPPTSLKLLARAVVDKNDLYRSAGIQDLAITPDEISGSAINFGTEEVSIPKLLISYFDADQKVQWVETKFIRQGIRQQRKRSFSFERFDLSEIENIYTADQEDLFVNGLANDSYIHQANTKKRNNLIQSGVEYISIKVDAYIGNPTIY